MLDKVKEVFIIASKCNLFSLFVTNYNTQTFLDKNLARAGKKGDGYSKAMGRRLGISVGI